MYCKIHLNHAHTGRQMRELRHPNIKLHVLKQNSVLSVRVYNAFCHWIALPDAVRWNLYLVRNLSIERATRWDQ